MDNKKLSPVSNNSHQSETIKVSISKGKATLLFVSFFLLFMSETFHEPSMRIFCSFTFQYRDKGFSDKRTQSIELFFMKQSFVCKLLLFEIFLFELFLHFPFNTMDYNEIIMQQCKHFQSTIISFFESIQLKKLFSLFRYYSHLLSLISWVPLYKYTFKVTNG